MSDRCTSRFGRRRPFIFVLGIGSYIGISLILNGYFIGQRLGDKNTDLPRIAIILTALGVTFLDFSADSSDSPLRAFLLDVCNTEDQDTGLNIHAFLGGMGSALGYVLSAIQWDKTFFKFIGDDLQILFVFATAIFIITLIISLTSVKETPLVLNQTESVPLLTGNAKNITDLPEDIAVDKIDEETNQIAENDEDDEEENDNMDQPVSLNLLLKSVLKVNKLILIIRFVRI
jgi:solute carrier family 45 protein 1/2/4